MTKHNPRREGVRQANEAVSRPEDPDSQRVKRVARRLRADTLPVGGAMLTETMPQEESETEAALKRATDSPRPKK